MTSELYQAFSRFSGQFKGHVTEWEMAANEATWEIGSAVGGGGGEGVVSCPDPSHVREGLVRQVQILGLASECESDQ